MLRTNQIEVESAHRLQPSHVAGTIEPGTADLIANLLAGSDSQQWGIENLRVLNHLREETDPQLFFSDLLSWARDQETSERPQLSQVTYQFLTSTENIPAWVQEQADHRLAVLRGEGSFFENGERFFSDTFNQVLTPANLLTMAGAGLTFRISRVGFLRLFSNVGLKGASLSVGAAGAAFNMEALSFPLLNRVLHQGFGGIADWSPLALSRDIYSSYLFLGGMRAAGFATGKFFQWGRAVPGAQRIWAPNLGRLSFTQRLAQSGSMLAGVMGAGLAEQWGGLKEFSSGQEFLQHSLSTFLQFKIAGAALHHGLGSRFADFERQMDLEALRYGQGATPTRIPPAGTMQSVFAGAAMTMGGGGTRGSSVPAQWMAMSQARPLQLRPVGNPSAVIEKPATPTNPAKPVAAPSRSQSGFIRTNGTPHVSRFELADALVRHRGNLDAAANTLGLTFEVLKHRLERETFFSDLSVFPVGGRGRMLFYRPALARARSQLGAQIYAPESLPALELSPATQKFAERMGVKSLWDLLMVTRADINRAKYLNESRGLIDMHVQEMQRKINEHMPNPMGKILENHPIGEGSVKVLMGRYLGEVPVADLGLAPEVFRQLAQGQFHTVADLMNHPIPQWIPHEAIAAGRAPGSREVMIDGIVRGLYGLLHGSGPRRYIEPSLDRTRDRFMTPAPPRRSEERPYLEGVSESELLHRLVSHGGNIRHVAETFGKTPEALAEFIQKHDYHSELSVYQGMGKGTMLFYTPALRQAASEFGTQVHSGESLSGLELSSHRQTQLQNMGVTSLRDLLLLTRYDLEQQLGSGEAQRFVEELNPRINTQLNRSGLRRVHFPFRPGMIKSAMLERYDDASLFQLRLRAPTRQLLMENGVQSMGELMRRPIPQWISPEQMPTGSHPATRSYRLDEVVRSCYALLRNGYRHPLEPQ